jgi:hypothetical protein
MPASRNPTACNRIDELIDAAAKMLTADYCFSITHVTLQLPPPVA